MRGMTGAWVLSLVAVGACELPVETGRREAPVIGGTPTEPGAYPSTGALLADGQFFCTGSLIAPTVVLTAAHCVDPFFLGDAMPSFTLELDATAPGTAHAGASMHQHPSFDLFATPASSGVSEWFDIGLLILEQPITTVPYTIMPSPTEAAEALVAGVTVELVGYGLTDPDGEAYGVKHDGMADLVEVGTAELLIAQPGQQQNCNGDSGGPAYLDVGGEQRVVGVVSRAPDNMPRCDHGGIDTRVDRYLEWIHATAGDALPCGTGLNPPCAPDAAPPDAMAPDAGVGAGDGSSGGCGCRAGDRPGAGGLLVLLALGLLGLVPNRR